MIKLLGFLIGSTVSISMLVLLLGIPDIRFSEPIIDDTDLDSVKHTVRSAKTDIQAVANEIMEEATDILDELPKEESPISYAAIEEVEEPEPTSEQPAVDHSGTRNDSNTTDKIIENYDDVVGNSTASNTTGSAADNEQRWHSFWNPFRSEIAANGFVTQLEKVTGLDYRVVKIKTGVYEVTFAYENDPERRTKLSQIASATGLDLPDS